VRHPFLLWALTAILIVFDVALLERTRAAQARARMQSAPAPIFVPRVVGYTSSGQKVDFGPESADFVVLVALSKDASAVDLATLERLSRNFVTERWAFFAYCLAGRGCPPSSSRVQVLTTAPVLLARNLESYAEKRSLLALDWKRSTVGEVRWGSEGETVSRLRKSFLAPQP